MLPDGSQTDPKKEEMETEKVSVLTAEELKRLREKYPSEIAGTAEWLNRVQHEVLSDTKK
ncbi:hypothetical protein KKC60_00595 [Patescibacteria group bacterium]|nr:hypothetical protein [Patescibacteria group bacterium]